eukprot:gene25275-38084_t
MLPDDVAAARGDGRSSPPAERDPASSPHYGDAVLCREAPVVVTGTGDVADAAPSPMHHMRMHGGAVNGATDGGLALLTR